ncbi:MAG: sigma 54-interacting transcriptional regulator [Tissierellia bacterium]|nr:sigma 54-interacting transcriptional regulator [Tissierellia bacterium]
MVQVSAKTYPDYVLKGWRRCEEKNTDINSGLCFFNISSFDLNVLLTENKDLIERSEYVLDSLTEYMNPFISAMLVNRNGYILKEKKCKGHTDSVNFPVGGRFLEKFNGNTAISTSIIENNPVCLVGEEHYCKSYYNYTTLSVPIHSDGEIIGVFSAIGLKTNVSKSALGMIAAAAKAISIGFDADKENKQLMAKNKYESTIVETMIDGVLTVDKDGFIMFMNQVGADILGVDRESSIGKHAADIVDFKPVILDVLKTGKGYVDKEFLITKKSGEKTHFVKTAVPIKDDKGNIVTVVDTFRKINRVNKLVNKMNGAYANFSFDDIIGSSHKIKDCITKAKAAAKSMSNVLITGESGTGKELIAQSIHSYSQRKNQPFVSINCGAIPRELLESELFGYEPGSFTGASKKGRTGKFELAEGGTIFLDEIGEMPLDMQVKLLRVIQEKKLTRIGGNAVFDLDVRIIAATNKDLFEECRKGAFREDLYYRINVLHVMLPPLRERKDDINELIHHFINKLNLKLDKDIRGISPEAMNKIMQYSWPGNVRELENTIERAVNLCKTDTITEKDIFIENFHKDLQLSVEDTKDLTTEIISETEIEPLEVIEKRAIERALNIAGGNITTTANLLKVTRNTIYNKIKRYNLLSS